ncbi:alpha/beta fold hydrolase [Nocardioides sp. NPDC000445]|uniref:alpha/beta fold hydrolase n=1 Tax=Nocardioides sp. NPDC000445 TaxID=3154257 RepID=UPI0033187E0D
MEALGRRLGETRWPVLPPADGRARGVTASTVERFVSEWEQWLAQPQSPGLGDHEVLDVGGQGVHVARFPGAGRVPILLLHGWPTSFLAFHQVIGPLRALVSEVVLASLPGFGTSQVPLGAWSVADSARLLADAMAAMGHDRFIVHGQDWGSVVARAAGAIAPDRVIGVHVSAGLKGFMAEGSSDESAWSRLGEFVAGSGGYLHLQSRRPDSLAYALSDSPVGLLVWQLDKYQLWQGGLGDDFGLGMDFILANATLYWLTGSAGSSMRIYSMGSAEVDAVTAGVPTAVSVFGSGDFAGRAVSARENNLVAWYAHDGGGHVASLDAATEFITDLDDFINRVGVNA